MRIAFFGTGAHPVDLKRHHLVAKAWGYDISLDPFVKKDPNKTGSFDLMLADSCDFKTLFKLCMWEMKSHFSKISFIALELFNLSFKAWFEELRFLIKEAKSTSNLKSILYFASVIPIKILLIRILLSKGEREVIVPSELRINFLKTVLPRNVAYILVRNKPILADLNFEIPEDYNPLASQAKAIIEHGNYLFIAGRINVEEHFFQVCKYADRESLKIIAATGQIEMLRRSVDQFPGLVLNLGSISNSLVMYISSRCLAGICLYHNFTSNQRLSASSKFFEFMLMNKPIIASDNPGMKGEIKPAIQHLIIFSEKLSGEVRINREEVKLNKEFSFEYELRDVSSKNCKF